MTGLKRNIKERLCQLLEWFPAVVITGARQVGKTTLVKSLGDKWHYFDLENPAHFDRITSDPLFFFQQYPDKVVIDEAQNWPELFPILRGIIDENRGQTGRFLLTGSSSPSLKSQISESLAGRIGQIELDPLKINEYYRRPLSPFYSIFKNSLHHKALSLIEKVTSTHCAAGSNTLV